MMDDVSLSMGERVHCAVVSHMEETGMEPGPEHEWAVGVDTLMTLYMLRNLLGLFHDADGRVRALFGVRVKLDTKLPRTALVLRRAA